MSWKTDCNFLPDKKEDLFQGTEWNQRKEGQPFFSRITSGGTHRAWNRDPLTPRTLKFRPTTPTPNSFAATGPTNELGAGGSTYASGGIKKAYELARKNFQPNGLNRVILATDGGFKVGITNDSDLKALIKKEARSGVSLIALGFGMGNHKDSTMQTLAQNGKGQHADIDAELEARKVHVKELGANRP
ncbi:MAG: VWA domain-containing protein [Akkermansiaceae bacterium]